MAKAHGFLLNLVVKSLKTRPQWHPMLTHPPNFKLIPQARRAMEALRGRLISHGAYRQLVTSTLGIDPTNLNRVWPALASQANKAELGAQHFADGGVRFPEEIEAS